jgi:hypothetical protein
VFGGTICIMFSCPLTLMITMEKSVRWWSVVQIVAERLLIFSHLGLSILNRCLAHSAVLFDGSLTYHDVCLRLYIQYIYIFFNTMPPHVPYVLRGLPYWLWLKCNRLLRLGRP